ncbi:MAG: hypothetical protein LBC75_05950 [Fibromonadaceae bacterium]|jgi:hypothetical protein|nr:hypothetical protein [Fibromonadaceae bacterium]
MKIQKFACVLFCLLLCSCPYEEENEPSTVAVPSSSSVEPVEPSILDCPLEDIDTNITKYYPDPKFDPPNSGSEYAGWCPPSALKLSVEELSFSTQGGVRCITASNSWIVGAYGKDVEEFGCYIEKIARFRDGRIFTQIPKADSVFVKVSDGSTLAGTRQEFRDFFGGWNWKFYKMVCPWFTATNVDIWTEGRQTLHISVNKNETGSERETSIGMSLGNCGGGFKITQSP